MSKAHVLVNCDLGSEKNVISSLKKVEDVKEAHGTFGLCDIILKIESEEKITKIVTQIILKIPKNCLIKPIILNKFILHKIHSSPFQESELFYKLICQYSH